jgi:hypothetical protein
LSSADQVRLEVVVVDRNNPQKHVWRARIVFWRAHGLQPHRCRRFKLSRDPNFAAKLRDMSPRNGAFAPFVRPTPQSDPWRHDPGRIVS